MTWLRGYTPSIQCPAGRPQCAPLQRIHALEVDIGTQLVFRSGRTIRPTPTAMAILERSRRLLRDVRDIKSIATSGMLTEELRLGVIPTTLSGLLPDILIPFTQAHSKIDVRIVRDHSVALYQRVLDEEIDAAISSHPPFALPKTCGWPALSSKGRTIEMMQIGQPSQTLKSFERGGLTSSIQTVR